MSTETKSKEELITKSIDSLLEKYATAEAVEPSAQDLNKSKAEEKEDEKAEDKDEKMEKEKKAKKSANGGEDETKAKKSKEDCDGDKEDKMEKEKKAKKSVQEDKTSETISKSSFDGDDLLSGISEEDKRSLAALSPSLRDVVIKSIVDKNIDKQKKLFKSFISDELTQLQENQNKFASILTGISATLDKIAKTPVSGRRAITKSYEAVEKSGTQDQGETFSKSQKIKALFELQKSGDCNSTHIIEMENGGTLWDRNVHGKMMDLLNEKK